MPTANLSPRCGKRLEFFDFKYDYLTKNMTKKFTQDRVFYTTPCGPLEITATDAIIWREAEDSDGRTVRRGVSLISENFEAIIGSK